MKELKETIDMMTSDDYKERFIAEYWQLRIRTHKLAAFIGKYRRDELDFIPSCPVGLLEQQADAMCRYLELLQKRAKIEGVDLIGWTGPVDVEKAMKWLADYAFADSKEVYTNGTVLVPLFRVEQAFEDLAYNGLCESC